MSSDDIQSLKKQNRELTKDATTLVDAIAVALASLDHVMKGPSTVERGQQVARIASFLELEADKVRHFGLNQSFKAMESAKRRAVQKHLNATGRGNVTP